MSKITGKIKALWKRLADPDYREGFVAGKVANEVAFQVFYLREHRGWTQGELAHRAGTQQPSISRLERSIGSVNVGTLLKVARAFNVGLSIRFVPFSKLVTEAVDGALDARVPTFDDDCRPFDFRSLFRVTETPALPPICRETDLGLPNTADFVWVTATAEAEQRKSQYAIN